MKPICLTVLSHALTVCKLPPNADVDVSGGFLFFARTSQEVSLVCETEYVPPSTLMTEHGWTALQVDGTLDFGLTGIIAGISSVLANRSIPVFVVSTYDTDYVLVKESTLESTIKALKEAGYAIKSA